MWPSGLPTTVYAEVRQMEFYPAKSACGSDRFREHDGGDCRWLLDAKTNERIK